jgi:hypothetical protein
VLDVLDREVTMAGTDGYGRPGALASRFKLPKHMFRHSEDTLDLKGWLSGR